MSSYDPAEDLLSLLKAALVDEVGIVVEKEWELKNIDLNQADYVLIRGVDEEDEHFGIGGLEFTRYVTADILVKSSQGRERVRKLGEMIRTYLRRKENWMVGDRLLLNMVVRNGDLTTTERGIWSLTLTVQWFQIEVRA